MRSEGNENVVQGLVKLLFSTRTEADEEKIRKRQRERESEKKVFFVSYLEMRKINGAKGNCCTVNAFGGWKRVEVESVRPAGRLTCHRVEVGIINFGDHRCVGY